MFTKYVQRNLQIESTAIELKIYQYNLKITSKNEKSPVIVKITSVCDFDFTRMTSCNSCYFIENKIVSNDRIIQ